MKILPNGRQLKFKLKGQNTFSIILKIILKEKFNMIKNENNKGGDK